MQISRTYPLYKSLFFYVAGTFLLFVAILFHAYYLYLMGAVMLMLPSVSNAIGRALLAGLSCERSHPTACARGEFLNVTLTVANTGRFPKFFLSVQDHLPRGLRVEGESPAALLQLWPGETAEIAYTLVPERRGVFAILATDFFSTDPLSIYVHSRTARCLSELTVYPTPLPLRRVFWEDRAGWGRRLGEDGSVRGEGQDFHSVREYRSGDDLRRVHWRTTARTGKLVVMEFEQGRSGDILIALDLNRDAYVGTGDGPDSPLETAVAIAASLAEYLLRQGCRVGLLTAARGALPLWAQGMEQMPELQDALARAQADALQTLPQLLEEAHDQHSAAGVTLVFITPRGDDAALAPALADWQARGARPVGFCVESARPRASLSLPAVPMAMIHPGDDLVAAIEGGSLAR
ncbi:MAG: DUF58 domain-containing protein [Armatimonadota bacterium]|nr:DUF58 domain-containing protein [Armatimonadota bacterium]